MMDFADSSFLASLYLRESTTKRAHAALQTSKRALAVTSLSLLELRNAFNRAVHLRRISPGQRDALCSDRHTPVLGTRSLDLLHVAAALLLDAKLFFSFDERQRTVAASEGLKVKP
jgi:predicted nucleic acid-binding protein